MCELSQALAQSEEQLSQLQSLSQSQDTEIQQLRNVCTQLEGVQEMNEVGVCFIFCSPLSVAFAFLPSGLDWNTLGLWKLKCLVKDKSLDTASDGLGTGYTLTLREALITFGFCVLGVE